MAEGPSTVFCVAVVAWTVVMRPSSIPKLSLTTLASGARQLVVHEAFDTTAMSPRRPAQLTPTTNMGASADGAEITTRFAPPCRCLDAPSTEVKTPVDSTTSSAPRSPHGIAAGSRSAVTGILVPSTTRQEAAASWPTSWPESTECTESYLSM